MSSVVTMLLLATLAGASMPIGALVGAIDQVHPRWLDDELRHSVIAFGGGALLSAVSLVLVPEGVRQLPLGAVVAAFLAGGIAFRGLESLLQRAQGAGGQLVAMLSDFLPEAIALGAAFASGDSVGLVLALLIALQNLPEGFNAYRELMATGRLSRGRTLAGFALLVPLGPAAALAGYWWLADTPRLVGAIMLFAASGILYLTFQDIAPQARLQNRTAPAVGAVLGFLVGLVGQQLLG